MKLKTNVTLWAMLLLCLCGNAQSPAPKQPPTKTAKQLSAIRTTQTIKIDGLINEDAWKDASVMTDLIEFRPTIGAPEKAATKTIAYLMYDDQGIYFGGHCYEQTKDSIATELSGRDGFGTNDYIGLIFDTYYDKQNGFEYFITPLGEQWDAKMTSDGEDFSWNAVWKSNAVIHDNGWSFEMFIPYSAIRFGKNDVQNWGLNITRRRRKTEQQYTWNPIDPNVNGFLTQEG
ncbi:MAG: carbohydrate binding family 9 domain-containing protein, partial [Chitinophagaceae bacterium]